VLLEYRGTISYSINDIKGISPSFFMRRSLLGNEHSRLANLMQEVVKKEVVKLLDAAIMYHIFDIDLVSLL